MLKKLFADFVARKAIIQEKEKSIFYFHVLKMNLLKLKIFLGITNTNMVLGGAEEEGRAQ
jgi:hypothetical protein